jgi:hypothetical protein
VYDGLDLEVLACIHNLMKQEATTVVGAGIRQ